MEKTRLRIRFTKTGDLRWISHRDLARVWERLLRRADLELAFSEGFHPKPKISFPSALALGIEALEEIVELEVVGNMPLAEIEQSIVAQLPAGMELLSLESPTYSLGKARVESATYRIPLEEVDAEALETRLAAVQQQSSIEVEREKKTIVCDCTNPLFSLEVTDSYFTFTLPTVQGAAIRPSELLEYLGLGHLLESGSLLQRTAVTLREPGVAPDAVHAKSQSLEQHEQTD